MANILSVKSEDTWTEGKRCLDAGMVNSAANRIYYSVFQAVKGYAIHRGSWTMETTDRVHTDALKFVEQSGKLGRFYRSKMNELFSLRVLADYYPDTVIKKDLEELLADADSIRRHHISRCADKT